MASSYPAAAIEYRRKHFPHLTDSGATYLDHAGATLYSRIQLEAHFQNLSSSLYANPHSSGPIAKPTGDVITAIRHKVLQFFNVSTTTHTVIFTSGATESLKLVGEHFCWNKNSKFYHPKQCHTSLLGVREFALKHAGSVRCYDLGHARRAYTQCCAESTRALFACPGECNFSGMQPNLSFLSTEPAAQKEVYVLLDAAKLAATSTIDLKELQQVDFTVISFYKMFGYPTGLGALVVKNSSAAALQRSGYFGGGTIAAAVSSDVTSSSSHDFRFERIDDLSSRFEDGSLSFLSLLAIPVGLKQLDSIGMGRISDHVRQLASLCMHKLMALEHWNGACVCKVYLNDVHEEGLKKIPGSNEKEFRSGSMVAFNVFDSNGHVIGCANVERLATLHRIQVRTGCFCNPGACQKYLQISNDEVFQNFEEGHVCGDAQDVIRGKPTGAVRASFGYMSRTEDVLTLVHFIQTSFVEKNERTCPNVQKLSKSTPKVLSVYVYPIKSCSGFRVPQSVQWPATHGGLLYDRQWALVTPSVSSDGTLVWHVLHQKKYPFMATIRTSINLDEEIMTIQADAMAEELKVSTASGEKSNCDGEQDKIVVCGEICYGIVSSYSKVADDWFSRFFKFPCKMIHYQELSERKKSDIRFSNAGQILLINRRSVADFLSRTGFNEEFEDIAAFERRFRPNIVVETLEPYEEDSWEHEISVLHEDDAMGPLKYRGIRFVLYGPCSRCRMINIDPVTGKETVDYLGHLSSYRFNGGSQRGQKTCFGQLLSVVQQEQRGEGIRHGDALNVYGDKV
eukprot:Stramenopile-MAST_4_protein_3841